jgi:uncharacterized protein YegP (UPF0339 family)
MVVTEELLKGFLLIHNSNPKLQMYYTIYVDASRQWRWRLQSGNHQIIAVSGEGYLHKQDCLSAIGLVKGSLNAPVYEA